MNFHFFTSDDCLDTIQITRGRQQHAYKVAEALLNAANDFLANNKVQWNGTTTEVPSNPIRYVLSGVFIHCKSKATGGGNTPTLHSTYGANKNSEINVYIADFPGGDTGIGFATYASIDWINTGNLNHEIGHVFSLWHPHDGDDYCDDTPPLLHNWDSNCNGIIEFNEMNKQCWAYTDINEPLNCELVKEGKEGKDFNRNGVHDCKEDEGYHPCDPLQPNTPGCQNRPCCDWANINNNVMAYNAYPNSYSSCQIRRMLTDLANADCGYIDKIGGYPPPSAFITQTPKDQANTAFCNECLIFEASSNDVMHKFQINEVSTGIVTYSSGWIHGEAKNYCFTTSDLFGYKYSNLKLKRNTAYIVELTVANAAGEEDHDEYTFTTPDGDCTIPPSHYSDFSPVEVIPNPISGGMALLEFTASEDEVVSIYTVNPLNSEVGILFEDYNCVQGVNQVELNLSALQQGIHKLVLLSQYQYATINISKF
jgi:hypothetical protein